MKKYQNKQIKTHAKNILQFNIKDALTRWYTQVLLCSYDF